MSGDAPPRPLWGSWEVAWNRGFSGHAQPALRWPYEFGGVSEETPRLVQWPGPNLALMRKSALVAALGTAVTTGGAIAALTVLPLNSVSAQSSGTTATTATTTPATRTCTQNEDPSHEAQET